MFKKKNFKTDSELQEITEVLKMLAKELDETTRKLADQVAKLKGEHDAR